MEIVNRNENDIGLIEEQILLSSFLFGSVNYKELNVELQTIFFNEPEHKALFSWLRSEDGDSKDQNNLQLFFLAEYGYNSDYVYNLLCRLRIVYSSLPEEPSLEFLNGVNLSLSKKRQGADFLKKAALTINEILMQDPESISKIIAELQLKSSILVESWDKPKEFFIGPEKVFEEIDQLVESIKAQSITTPFHRLNELTNGGFKPGELIVIGARPSIGKTTFACNLCLHFALTEMQKDQQIIFWTLEDSRAMIQAKQLSMFLQDNFLKPKNPLLTKTNLPLARKQLSSLPIKYAHDHVSIEKFCSQIKRIHTRCQCKIIIIDYVNKIRSDIHRNTRAEDVGTIASCLRELAKSCQSSVILLAQINRNSESRVIRMPQLHDLKESGSLEESADIVLLLHREYQSLLCNPPQTHERTKIQEYQNALLREKNKAKIFVAKNKFNETGPIDLYFYPEHIGFSGSEKI